jgi:hypothetical protein
MMFAELERFLTAHCRTDRHRKVLDCLLEVRNRGPGGAARKDPDKVSSLSNSVTSGEKFSYKFLSQNRGKNGNIAHFILSDIIEQYTSIQYC